MNRLVAVFLSILGRALRPGAMFYFRIRKLRMTTASLSTLLSQVIKAVPDYPKPGILFRDVTSLMLDADAFGKVIDAFKQQYQDKGSFEGLMSFGKP